MPLDHNLWDSRMFGWTLAPHWGDFLGDRTLHQDRSFGPVDVFDLVGLILSLGLPIAMTIKNE